MYWGELPLSFAACTNNQVRALPLQVHAMHSLLQDCFRLLRAFKADPNMTDTNGNTVLHLTVIHDLPVRKAESSTPIPRNLSNCRKCSLWHTAAELLLV